MPALRAAFGGAVEEMRRQCQTGQANCVKNERATLCLRLETDNDSRQKTLVVVAVAGLKAVELESEIHTLAKLNGASLIRLHATGSPKKIGALGRMYQVFFQKSRPMLIESIYQIKVM